MKPQILSLPHTTAPLSLGDLIDEKEAAHLLGTAVATLRNWRSQGTGPKFRKIGLRLVRYYRSDLVDFIEDDTSKDAAP
jgi:predicted DNA-binding transcriptional regulator AlpA